MTTLNFSNTNTLQSIGQPILFGESEASKIPVPHKTFLGDPSKSLYEQTFDIYSKVLKYQGIARIWNYIPNINALYDGETDFYMRFNQGRYDAWVQYGPTDMNGKPMCPSATGIGATAGPLRVDIVLSDNRLIHLDNRRQSRFVDYTRQYGAKPPCASRLTIEECSDSWKLWVAGTSAVVGQDTQGSDLFTQCRVTWDNLLALLSHNPELEGLGVPTFDIHTPSYVRAYLRDRNALGEYRKMLSEFFTIKPVIHQADICRGSLTGMLYHEVECLYEVRKT